MIKRVISFEDHCSNINKEDWHLFLCWIGEHCEALNMNYEIYGDGMMEIYPTEKQWNEMSKTKG